MQVKDTASYIEQYATPLMAQFATISAKVVAAGGDNVDHLEDHVPGNWHVIIEFPGMDTARHWYESDGYQPLKTLRINELTDGGSASLVPGFAIPA